MKHPNRDFGQRAWVGFGTPQANPTVEAEMRQLMPADVHYVMARLLGSSTDSETRLRDYIENLDDYLRQYDVLKVDAFGFACTGSSYLIGAAREREIAARLEATFGYPIVTAAEAIVSALDALGAKRIAILAPYPEWLVDEGVNYYRGKGLAVVDVQRIDTGSGDTRAIYGLSVRDAIAALGNLDLADADAVLLSGTGMPTLGAIAQGEALAGKPIISSNYCLAWEVLRRVDALGPNDRSTGFPLLGAWQAAAPA